MSVVTTRDGCELRYREAGASPDSGAETLLLLSGWSQTAAMFDRLVDELADSYRVVTYDHRNHGESGSTENGARIAALASDLGEVIGQLELDRVHLLGNSMGCSVIWSYLDNFGSSKIASTILVDQPSVCALVPWLTPAQRQEVGAIVDFQGAADLIQALLRDDSANVRRDFVRSMMLPEMDQSDVDFIVAENMKLRFPFGARLLLDHIMQDWRDLLPRIDVPTLVVGGELSHVDFHSQLWNASQIPNAEVRIMTKEERGDHFPFFQNPRVFASVIREFIDPH